MKASVTFSGLDVWQMGRLIRAAERAGGLPDPVVNMADAVDLVLTEALPAVIVAGMPVIKMRDMRAMFAAAGATIEFRDGAQKAVG